MAGRALNESHPFWETACEMAKAGAKFNEIADAAWDAGFNELSYRQIIYGINHMPVAWLIPARAGRQLRDRFAQVSNGFNSYVAQRDLAQAAIAKIEELEAEIASGHTTELREQYLRGELWRWYGRAFEWSLACSEVALKIDEKGLDPRELAQGAEPLELTAGEERVRIDTEQERLFEEFEKRMPKPAPEDQVRIYGGDNLSFPIDLNGEEEESDDEDEEF